MKIRNMRRQAIRRHSDMLAVVNANLAAQEKLERSNKRKKHLSQLLNSTWFWIKVTLITLASIITIILFMSFQA